MARSADPELRRWWGALVDSFDATRESVAEFCDRHEVSTASFYAWRRKLAAASTRAGSGRRRTLGRSRTTPSTTADAAAESPAERQAEPSAERQAESPAERQAESSAERQAEPSAERQAESSAERQAEPSAFLPVQIINAQEPNCLRVRLSGGMCIELPVHQRQLLLDLVTHIRGDSSSDVSEANR